MNDFETLRRIREFYSSLGLRECIDDKGPEDGGPPPKSLPRQLGGIIVGHMIFDKETGKTTYEEVRPASNVLSPGKETPIKPDPQL